MEYPEMQEHAFDLNVVEDLKAQLPKGAIITRMDPPRLWEDPCKIKVWYVLPQAVE